MWRDEAVVVDIVTACRRIQTRIDIRAMRNVLVHDYLGVNLDKVWFTVLHEVPRLLAMMQPFMPPDDGRAS